jgi:hypothetical protein
MKINCFKKLFKKKPVILSIEELILLLIPGTRSIYALHGEKEAYSNFLIMLESHTEISLEEKKELFFKYILPEVK